MPSHWFGWILSRHCPEVKGEFQFSQKNLRPRQKQQRAPGGQYGLEQAARQPGGERHDEKQQCQNQNKPGQPEAVVPGGDFFERKLSDDFTRRRSGKRWKADAFVSCIQDF